MAKYSLPPTSYHHKFRTMSDIYQDYRKTMMNKGLYRPYFESRTSYGESTKKFNNVEYSGSREPTSSKGEREVEPSSEIKPNQTNEIQTEQKQKEDSQKTETSQKVETKQETEAPQKTEHEKETRAEQTNFNSGRKPFSYYNGVEYSGEFF